jgi:hypothetical protein
MIDEGMPSSMVFAAAFGPEQPVRPMPTRRGALANRRVEMAPVPNTWSKLSVDRQVTQALHQAPANAGPINSHMLVLRSLTLMRDISPEYLNRFISYADTLLCLHPDEMKKQLNAKEAGTGESAKKPKNASRPNRVNLCIDFPNL